MVVASNTVQLGYREPFAGLGPVTAMPHLARLRYPMRGALQATSRPHRPLGGVLQECFERNLGSIHRLRVGVPIVRGQNLQYSRVSRGAHASAALTIESYFLQFGNIHGGFAAICQVLTRAQWEPGIIGH